MRVEIPARVTPSRKPVAWYLEPHDLVLSKRVAGRDRDWQFSRDMLVAGLVQRSTLLARVDDLPIELAGRRHVRKMLRALRAPTSS